MFKIISNIKITLRKYIFTWGEVKVEIGNVIFIPKLIWLMGKKNICNSSSPPLANIVLFGLPHSNLLSTICNNPDPPLVDIVLFGLSLSGLPSRRFPHPYKWWFVLLSN